ncbi:ribosome biogenesis protein BRX1 homolog [Diadema setosum]|uniref:ribosome biogenesis protein BRX1 homolog n=1 Tax=Diadema setosum TaxID=31175 RepID=UPI003B3B3124
MGKRKYLQQILENKRKKEADSEGNEPCEGDISNKKVPAKWTNKERVLVFASRGVSYRGRHLMNDLRTLMPHSRADSKMDRKDNFFLINEICEMRNCNKCIFFEARKKMDLYLWFANIPHGPSAKFLVENIHTMAELKLTGNCLKGSRPLLSFDPKFDETAHHRLLKELFTQIFSTPHLHPKSQPFTDNVYTFTILDNRIWFRNYQIVEEDGSLAEIGPRLVLNLIKVFGGSFVGPTLYENPHYVSPNQHRSLLKKQASLKYQNRVEARMGREERRETETYKMDTLEEVFHTIRPEDAQGAEKMTFFRK